MLNMLSKSMITFQDTTPVNIAQMTKSDFLQIVDDHSQYWDSDLTYQLHHPMFINEFADTAYTLKDGENIAAYLMGFISQTEPCLDVPYLFHYCWTLRMAALAGM